jgi:hypothetical protein
VAQQQTASSVAFRSLTAASATCTNDTEGRQYVHGDDGERVYGTWIAPADEPIVVE